MTVPQVETHGCLSNTFWYGVVSSGLRSVQQQELMGTWVCGQCCQELCVPQGNPGPQEATQRCAISSALCPVTILKTLYSWLIKPGSYWNPTVNVSVLGVGVGVSFSPSLTRLTHYITSLEKRLPKKNECNFWSKKSEVFRIYPLSNSNITLFTIT